MPNLPRFDESKPARCGAFVGEGGHGQLVTCGAALGEGLRCWVCGDPTGRQADVMGGDAPSATRCGGHCNSAAHYGLPTVMASRGGWRGAGEVEVLYGEERPAGGLYYAELLSAVSGRPMVLPLARSGLARGSGQTAEEARAELRAKMAEEFGDGEPTEPMLNVCDVPEAEPSAAVDPADPATWVGLQPEQVATALAVPGPADAIEFARYQRRVRAAVLEHLAAWGETWDAAEEKSEEGGEPMTFERVRALRSAELCALIAAIGGVR